jgi:Protein of unknown function (DUF1566)
MTTSFIARAAAIATFSWVSFAANGQARLNDTGVMQAYDSGGLWTCNVTNTGDAAAHPRQDCRFGRDAQVNAGTLTKVGGGPAGFDWTPINASGGVVPIAGGVPSIQPTCVRDNVTSLMWEVKTNDTGPRGADHIYYWYDSNSSTNGGQSGTADSSTACGGVGCDTEKFINSVNASALCGVTGWRMPTRRELFSIVQNGLASASMYDSDYFPNSRSGLWFWSSESYRSNTGFAWVVNDAAGPAKKLGTYCGNLCGFSYERGHVRAVKTLP